MRYRTVLAELVFISVSLILWLGIQDEYFASSLSKALGLSPGETIKLVDVARAEKGFDWDKVCYGCGALFR